ncbi:MAG TPA: signal peptidase II [Actinobacteria bacterium]|nr:signal peptidase II [Actinomycetota bacterium]
MTEAEDGRGAGVADDSVTDTPGPDDAAPDDAAPDDQDARPAVDPAVRRRCLGILAGVAIGAVVLDQLVKWWVVSSIRPRLEDGEGPIVLLGGLLKFTYVENTGAAFSIGVGYTWIFTIVAIVVAGVILRTSRRLGSLGWAVALGGLLGGLLGNLIDRLTRPPGPGLGYVVDFIQLPYFAVFNIADMFITLSAAGMVLLALRGVEINGRRS